MAFDILDLAWVSNVALGSFLIFFAVLVRRHSPDEAARGPLAIFLGLVGANYLTNGGMHMLPAWGQELNTFSLVLNWLDPAALVAFAFAVTGAPLRGRRLLFLVAPVVTFAAFFLFARPENLDNYSDYFGPIFMGVLFTYYPLGFYRIAKCYLSETRTLQRDRLGTLVVAVGIVVLPRLPLSYLDWGLHRTDFLLHWPVYAATVLLAMALGVASWLRRAAAPQNVAHARRTARALVGFLFVVCALWLLLEVRSLGRAAFALIFSARWFLFAVVFSVGMQRYDLIELPGRVERRVRFVLTVFLLAIGAAELAVVLGGIPGLPVQEAVMGAVVAVLAGTALVVSLRDAAPTETELGWRSHAAYRASVELGKTEAELAALQQRLGITDRDAKRLRLVAQTEREAPAPEPLRLAEGELVLRRYAVKEFLGAGTFGRVFAAKDTASGERVVLKELSPSWQNDEEALARFRREAEIALGLVHPNLVEFRGLEIAADTHVLVLQFVEGETLRARFARGKLSPAEAASLARDLCSALGALHEAGILHRDVKPDNIILAQDGRAVLLDFGSATSPAAGGTRLARAHPGTRGYMSPEQAVGRDLSAASDVYALGVTIWEALAGKAYPHGEVPPSWRAILSRATQVDPNERFGSAAEFSAALPVEATVR